MKPGFIDTATVTESATGDTSEFSGSAEVKCKSRRAACNGFRGDATIVDGDCASVSLDATDVNVARTSVDRF